MLTSSSAPTPLLFSCTTAGCVLSGAFAFTLAGGERDRDREVSGELVFLRRFLAGGAVSLPPPRVLSLTLTRALPFPFAVPTREVDGAVRLGGDRDLVSDRESDRESLLSRAAFVRARGGGDLDRDRESYELLGLLARLLGGEREPSLPAFSLRFGGDAERVYERPRTLFLLGGS